MRAALALLLLAAGCAREPKREPTPPPSNTAPAAASAAPDAAPSDPCVADCVARNQMRATSPEQIERECREQCVGPKP